LSGVSLGPEISIFEIVQQANEKTGYSATLG
jgi:hypothetical protein